MRLLAVRDRHISRCSSAAAVGHCRSRPSTASIAATRIAKGTERGTLKCDVGDVKPVGDATVSRVQCAPPYSGLLLVGWVSTPAGLYHPALPVDDAARGIQHGVEAFSHGKSWCARDTTVAETDRRHYTLCVGAGGVTGGGELVVTGSDRSWHRTTFGSVPEDPDDPTLGHSD